MNQDITFKELILLIDRKAKIFIAGDRSQTAKDLKSLLLLNGYENIIGCNTSNLDLRDQLAVNYFFKYQKPDVVFIVAARRGNFNEQKTVPFDYLSDNLLITLNLINFCIKYHSCRVIFFSSDGSTPCYSDGRMTDETQLDIPPINDGIESYSIAKWLGNRMMTYANNQITKSIFTSLLPCYVYGKNCSGIVDAIVKDFILAKMNNLPNVKVWGNGNLKIKIIHHKDVANAAYFAMNQNLKYDHYLVAPNEQVSKKELATVIAKTIDYQGEILFDETKSVRRIINSSPERLNQEGWHTEVSLEEGIKEMIDNMRDENGNFNLKQGGGGIN